MSDDSRPPPRLMAVALKPIPLPDWCRLHDQLSRGDTLIDLPRGVELHQLKDGRWEILEANLGDD